MSKPRSRPAAALVPSLAALAILGLAALAGCRDRDPNTPIAAVSTPFGQGGVVEVRYTLRNPDTANVTIDVLVFPSVGGPFNATEVPGGEGKVGLEASPGGEAHIFRWDSLADLGPGQHAVALQIVPRLDRRGTIGQTSTFTVFNTDLPARLPDLALAVQRGASSPAPRGGVLLSGGTGFGGDTAELVDGDGALLARAPLTQARERHAQASPLVGLGDTAAPLVLGGLGGAGPLASVERYDASTDAWGALAALTGPRLDHTATLLEDGDHVLVAGGRTDLAGTLAAADVVYDARGAGAEIALGGVAAARVGHTATLLPDGRVLVAGGADAGGAPLATTVIVSFDAVAGSGTAVAGPTLATARSGHAAAVLGGTLVIFGGAVDLAGTATDSAEAVALEPPLTATSTFAAVIDASTGSSARMTTRRADHRAIALGDGQALISGGTDGATTLASLERFVLTSSASSTAAAIGAFTASREPGAVARRGHDLAAFGPGAALIAGGGSAVVEAYRSAESGIAGGARPEARLLAGRVEHTATLLANGRALLAGGSDGVVDAGTGSLGVLATAFIYDPARSPDERFAATGALVAARRAHAAARLGNGLVVVAGGLGGDGLPLASLERFDLGAASGAGGFATSTQSLPAGRSGLLAAGLEDGRVLLAGGVLAGGAPTDEAFLYDGALDLLVPATPMNAARAGFALVALGDGRVLAAGGDAAGTVEVFDPTAGAAGAWTAIADPGGAFGGPRTDLVAVVLGTGRVLLAGGRAADGTPVATACAFDPASDTLEALAPLAVPRAGAVGVRTGLAVDEDALLAGGATRVPAGATSPLARIRTASIERYDAALGGSTAPALDPDLASAVEGAAAVRLNDGSLLITGGRDAAGTPRAGAERIGP